jgi:hypothetical protein
MGCKITLFSFLSLDVANVSPEWFCCHVQLSQSPTQAICFLP